MSIDVVVIGLGAMGSAALYELAKRGVSALGIEQFEPAHDCGSSHGLTRIVRLGYFEHPSYVPLVQRSVALWRELEKAGGERLLTVTGIVEMGLPESELVSGTLTSSQQHRLAHEVLDARALMKRYPAFRLPGDFIGVWQPDAGFVEPEKAILANLSLARRHGAQIRTGERVIALEPKSERVIVRTDSGEIEAGQAIVAAGPWATKLLPDLDLPLTVTRQAVLWFAPENETLFARVQFPVFMLESEHGIHYGFPYDRDQGLKIAKHHHASEAVDPDSYDRSVTAADEAMIRSALEQYIPAANGERLAARTCLYTMTPDGDFVIDRTAASPQIIVASPCSGHGFKFAPVIGEILADLATTGGGMHDISRFRLARFG